MNATKMTSKQVSAALWLAMIETENYKYAILCENGTLCGDQHDGAWEVQKSSLSGSLYAIQNQQNKRIVFFEHFLDFEKFCKIKIPGEAWRVILED